MTCPICNSSVIKLTEIDSRELVICANCRHICWAVLPTVEFLKEHYARTYTSTHGQEDIQAGNRTYYQSHARSLRKTISKPLRIADIGCSYPVFLDEAKKQGAHVLGVDMSTEATAWGADHGIPVISPEVFAHTRNEALNVLRYSHTLEHCIDPLGTLRGHLAKLVPGGLVYITQPNFPVFHHRPAALPLHDAVWPEHLHFFNPLSLRLMMENAGLHVTSLYSLTDENVAIAKFRDAMDVEYAKERLADIAHLGERSFGKLNNFPFYVGLNANAFGIKRA